MRFHTATASALALTLALLSTVANAAAPTPCQKCVQSLLEAKQPACANLGYLGNVENIVFDKLSNKEKTCLCTMTSSADWYLPCQKPDACSAREIDVTDFVNEALKKKVFCPNGGVFTDAANGGCLMSSSKVAAGITVAAAVVGALV
ncbi:hypothetical protein BGX29_008438 [Mortierella sp. GBA35]|nr:hypothetical protein BGX29_008438 [Mortierella sp. GBA35]